MKKGIVAVTLLTLCVSVSLAEDGLPSKSKLNRLGLASMQAMSDSAGQEVRGKGFVKIIFTWQASAGEKAILDPVTGNLSIDPANFIANDFNNGAGVTEDGIPLRFDMAQAQLVNLAATADHQQVILDAGGNVACSEISSSMNTAQVFAGDFAQFP